MNIWKIIYNYQVLLLHGMRPYWWVVANATKCIIFFKESILSGDLKLNLLQNILKERACWKSDFPCPRLSLVSVTPYRNKKENVFYSIEEMTCIFTLLDLFARFYLYIEIYHLDISFQCFVWNKTKSRKLFWSQLLLSFAEPTISIKHKKVCFST